MARRAPLNHPYTRSPALLKVIMLFVWIPSELVAVSPPGRGLFDHIEWMLGAARSKSIKSSALAQRC
jgi:hypothetical protein